MPDHRGDDTKFSVDRMFSPLERPGRAMSSDPMSGGGSARHRSLVNQPRRSRLKNTVRDDVPCPESKRRSGLSRRPVREPESVPA